MAAKKMTAGPDYAPRWIVDLETMELFERQADNSYRAVYRIVRL